MYNERREQEPFTGCPLSPLSWGMAILPEGTTEGKSAFIHTRWVIRTYLSSGAEVCTGVVAVAIPRAFATYSITHAMASATTCPPPNPPRTPAPTLENVHAVLPLCYSFDTFAPNRSRYNRCGARQRVHRASWAAQNGHSATNGNPGAPGEAWIYCSAPPRTPHRRLTPTVAAPGTAVPSGHAARWQLCHKAAPP